MSTLNVVALAINRQFTCQNKKFSQKVATASVAGSGSNSSEEAIPASLLNHGSFYSVEIELGSPGQKVSVDLDTGSSDLWVDSSAFDPLKSSHYKDTGAPFQITYGDQSSASGTFVTDDITLGGTTIQNGNFAYATQSTLPPGNYVFGISYAAGEAAQSQYDNYPVQLKKQGFTQRIAYSLWLNDWNQEQGAILFGGVDHSKYEGKLAKLPVVSVTEQTSDGGVITPKNKMRLTILLNSISISANGKSVAVVSGAHTPVLLDSGTTLGVLPDDWVEALADVFEATYNEGAKLWVTNKQPVSGAKLEFNFSGVPISAPIDGFLRPWYDDNNQRVQIDGKDASVIGVQGSGSKGVHLDQGLIYIFGDAFLSGAYIAFDLESDIVAIADAKLGSDASGEPEIEAIGSAGIPGVNAPNYSTATASDSKYQLHKVSGFTQ